MKILILSLCTLIFVSCTNKTEESKGDRKVDVTEARKLTKKGLLRQQLAPQISTTDIDGKKFDLKESLQEGPVVLVFYRGGWCPYCSLQLRNLQAQALPKVTAAGGKLVAISVDKPDAALKTKGREKLGMTILSDPKAQILKAYKVDYKVPEALVEKYIKKYKIDLEAHSGEKHHIIAVPAVYVVNQQGAVTFSYVNEDYKVRAQVEDIIAAVEKL